MNPLGPQQTEINANGVNCWTWHTALYPSNEKLYLCCCYWTKWWVKWTTHIYVQVSVVFSQLPRHVCSRVMEQCQHSTKLPCVSFLSWTPDWVKLCFDLQQFDWDLHISMLTQEVEPCDTAQVVNRDQTDDGARNSSVGLKSFWTTELSNVEKCKYWYSCCWKCDVLFFNIKDKHVWTLKGLQC